MSCEQTLWPLLAIWSCGWAEQSDRLIIQTCLCRCCRGIRSPGLHKCLSAASGACSHGQHALRSAVVIVCVPSPHPIFPATSSSSCLLFIVSLLLCGWSSERGDKGYQNMNICPCLDVVTQSSPIEYYLFSNKATRLKTKQATCDLHTGMGQCIGRPCFHDDDVCQQILHVCGLYAADHVSFCGLPSSSIPDSLYSILSW